MHPPRLGADPAGRLSQALPRANGVPWPDTSGSRERREFAAFPWSVRDARHWTSGWLAGCDPPYSSDVIDAVVLLVSELVTNAVQAVEAALAALDAAPASPPAAASGARWSVTWPRRRPRILGGPAKISLILTAAVDRVRIEVHDFACAPVPSALDPESADEAGRGLAVVGAMASRWGWQPSPFGKVVWCELSPSRP